MIAHEGHKATPLHPTYLKFLSKGIAWIVVVIPTEETTYIGIPIGDTTKDIVKTRRYLILEGLPIRVNITTPAEGAVVLYTE